MKTKTNADPEVTLHDVAARVLATYGTRLRDEPGMLAFGQAMEALRQKVGDGVNFAAAPPEVLPDELQAMTHISKVLGVLSESARFRTILVVALTLAPDVFSDREYSALVSRAKSR